MRLILYTGKGGVGKTTTAAATAACAAARGLRTLVVSADSAHSLGDVLEERLGPEPREVAPRLRALEVDCREEMARHWGSVRDYLVSLFRYQGIEEIVAEELALLPGAEELTTLLAVQEHGRAGEYELVVVDCAPTDSTLRLLTLPEVATGTLKLILRVQQTLSRVVTPLARQLVHLPLPGAEVFADTERLLYERLAELREQVARTETSVRLVVTSERMVIDEALRALTDLALFDVSVDGVVMNRVLPEAAVAEPFFRDWGRVQEERRAEIEELFEPLPVLLAPLREDEVTGVARLAAHGAGLFGDRSPADQLGRAARLRFVKDPSGYRVELPLPHARASELDVAKLGGELLITSGPRRRALKLPERMRSLELARARLDAGRLVVHLEPAAVAP